MFENIENFRFSSAFFEKPIKISALFLYCVLIGVTISVVSPIFALAFVLPIFIPILMGNLFGFEFPVRVARNLLVLYFFVMAIWPSYLAIQLPGPDLNPQRLVLIALLFLIVCSLFSWKARKWIYLELSKGKWWVIGLLLLFVHRFVSAMLGMGPMLSVGMVLREFVEVFLVGVMAYLLFSSFLHARRLFFLFMVCGLVASLLGCIEFLLKRNFFESISIPGMALDPDYVLSALSDKTRGDRYRAQGAFFHPLLLAEYCAYATPLAFYFSFFGERKIIRDLGVLSVFVVPVGAFLTGSRSAFLVTAILFVLCFIQIFWTLRRSKKNGALGWYFLIGILLLCFVLIPFVIYSGIADSIIRGNSLAEVQSTNARIRMFVIGIPAILESPFFGYGVGFAATVAGVANSIDSFYLSFSLESGVIGMIILLYILTIAGLKAVDASKGSGNLNESMFVMAIVLSLFGSMMVKLILSLNGNNYLLIVTSGVMVCASRWRIESQSKGLICQA